MLRINCPWCGDRAQIEFTYGGDGSVQRPRDPEPVSAKEWFTYLYLRQNEKGPHLELWQHSGGCRRWLKVRRDTLTHEIQGSWPAAGAEPEAPE
jgi:sarcosine oxidase subunit delta